jgi:hypothetical protein
MGFPVDVVVSMSSCSEWKPIPPPPRWRTPSMRVSERVAEAIELLAVDARAQPISIRSRASHKSTAKASTPAFCCRLGDLLSIQVGRMVDGLWSGSLRRATVVGRARLAFGRAGSGRFFGMTSSSLGRSVSCFALT